MASEQSTPISAQGSQARRGQTAQTVSARGKTRVTRQTNRLF